MSRTPHGLEGVDELDIFLEQLADMYGGEVYFKQAKAALLAREAEIERKARLDSIGQRLAEDDVTDLKCSVCWRAPSRLYNGLFYCATHFQEELSTTPGNKERKPNDN